MISLNFRQGVISTAKNPVRLSASTLTLLSPTKSQYSASHGSSEYLIEESVDVSVTLPYERNHIYVDIDMVTAQKTYGVSEFKLLYGNVFPDDCSENQHYFDIVNSIMYYWNGNSWIECIRVFICSVIEGKIGYYNVNKTQVATTQRCVSSNILFESTNFPIKKIKSNTRYEFLTAYDASKTNNVKRSKYMSFDNILQYSPIAGENIPAKKCVGFNETSEIVVCTEENMVPCIGIAISACSQGDTVNIIYSGAITDYQWSWSGSSIQPVFMDLNGGLVLESDRIESVQKIGYVLSTNAIYVDVGDFIRVVSV